MSLNDQILNHLNQYPNGQTDSQLAKDLHQSHQAINQMCRILYKNGMIMRDGNPLLNRLASRSVHQKVQLAPVKDKTRDHDNNGETPKPEKDIVVIQCAGTKCPRAGIFSLAGGHPVTFVADPRTALPSPEFRPDDPTSSSSVRTWRDELASYNATRPMMNPLGLFSASGLYCPPTDKLVYQDLVKHFSPQKVYILSAGWGLVRSDYLLPQYDITFSHAARTGGKAKPYAWRDPRTIGVWKDFDLLTPSLGNFTGTVHVLICGNPTSGYHLLLAELMKSWPPSTNVCFHYKGIPPPKPTSWTGIWRVIAHIGSRRTNWHYECARNLIGGASC